MKHFAIISAVFAGLLMFNACQHQHGHHHPHHHGHPHGGMNFKPIPAHPHGPHH